MLQECLVGVLNDVRVGRAIPTAKIIVEFTGLTNNALPIDLLNDIQAVFFSIIEDIDTRLVNLIQRSIYEIVTRHIL